MADQSSSSSNDNEKALLESIESSNTLVLPHDVLGMHPLISGESDSSSATIIGENDISLHGSFPNPPISPFATDSKSSLEDGISCTNAMHQKENASPSAKTSRVVDNGATEAGPSGTGRKRARNKQNGDLMTHNDQDGLSIPKLGRFNTPSNVFDAVEMLQRQFPSEDPNALYNRLDNAPDFKQECWKIVADLIDKKLQQTNGQDFIDSGRNIESLSENLFSKVATILAIHPNEDPNRLYSRLESVDSSLLDEAVQQILQELEIPTQVNDSFPLTDFEGRPGPSHRSTDGSSLRLANGSSFRLANGSIAAEFDACADAFAKTEFLTNEDKNKVRHICSIFPNVDPCFLIEEVLNSGGRFNMDQFIEERMVTKRYPTLKDRMEKERLERFKTKLTDPSQFKVEEFLEIFEDPETFFMDIARPITTVYEQYAIAFLENEFRHLTKQFIQEQLSAFNNHFLPTARHLALTEPEIAFARGKGQKQKSRENPTKYRAQKLRKTVAPPDVFEEIFYRELQYYHHAQEIQDYLDSKKAEREIFIENARQANLLDECQCCFSDQILPNEILTCNNDHKFCQDCIKSQAKEILGRGGHLIKCLADNCDFSYPIQILKTLLNSQLTSLIFRRSAEEDLRLAGIENLKQCKYCDFQMVIDNPDEKLFQCRNPQCLKEYCLICEEPNHIPLRCEEVEKSDETAMRLYIEDKMAMALIRNCPNCHKKIVKDEGCNHMHCVCGCDFCYVCGRFYSDHENGQYCIGDERKLHVSDVRRAGEKAKKEYLKDHPDLRRARAPDVKKLTGD